MYSAPLYFADAQITDAFENPPVQNLCSSSQKATERWGRNKSFSFAQKGHLPTKYPVLKEQPAL